MPTQSLHVFLIITVLSVVLPAQEQSTRNTPFTPNQFPLPVKPPADAVVLSDGDTTSLFLSMAGTAPDWPGENGCLISSRGTGRTNHLALQLHFHDAEIHVEFMVDPQGRGNSGLYIHGLYELQIFDSFGKKNLARKTRERCTVSLDHSSTQLANPENGRSTTFVTWPLDATAMKTLSDRVPSQPGSTGS